MTSGEGGGGEPAAVQATFSDAGLRGRLASSDYLVRDQAQAELSAIYQRAYGDGPGEGPGPMVPGISEGMRAGAEASLDVAADAIPPEASYISPQAFRETPAVEGLFKSWCRDGEFTQLEAIGVAAAVDEFDRTGADITRWPAHLREARLKALEEAFNADPQGRQTLARVRAVFAEMRRAAPELAELFDQAGASSAPCTVKPDEQSESGMDAEAASASNRIGGSVTARPPRPVQDQGVGGPAGAVSGHHRYGFRSSVTACCSAIASRAPAPRRRRGAGRIRGTC